MKPPPVHHNHVLSDVSFFAARVSRTKKVSVGASTSHFNYIYKPKLLSIVWAIVTVIISHVHVVVERPQSGPFSVFGIRPSMFGMKQTNHLLCYYHIFHVAVERSPCGDRVDFMVR